MSNEDVEKELKELRAKVNRYERPFKQKAKDSLSDAKENLKLYLKITKDKVSKKLTDTKVMIGLKFHKVRDNAKQKWHDWKDAQDTIIQLRYENEKYHKLYDDLREAVKKEAEKIEEIDERPK